MRLTNNQIALICIAVMMFSIVFNMILTQKATTFMTGKSTASGLVNVCLNRVPVISQSCSATSVVGVAYYCDVDVSDADNTILPNSQTIAFSDNTGLFDINTSTGVIQFTPSAGDVGGYSVTITALDNSTCDNSADTDIVSITVSNPFCGDGSCLLNESCSTCPADCGACAAPSAGGAGGGGAGGGPAIADESFSPDSSADEGEFIVSQSLVRVSLKQGEQASRTISVFNGHGKQIEVEYYLEGVGAIVSLDSASKTIDPIRSKGIKLFFDATGIDAGVYTGKLIIEAEGQREEINLLIEIETSKVIFDVKTHIPPRHNEVDPGDEMTLTVDLYNLAQVSNQEILVTYQIRDFDGRVHYAEEETFTTTDDMSFQKNIRVPESLAPGQYVWMITVKAGEHLGIDSDVFEIKGEEIERFAPLYGSNSLIWSVIGLLAAGLVVSFFAHRSPTPVQNDAHRAAYLRKRREQLLKKIRSEVGHMKGTKVDVGSIESRLKNVR